MERRLVLHPTTKKHVAKYVTDPVHALLLVGQQGIGKTTIAMTMLTEILTHSKSELHQHPYFLSIAPENGTISIDVVRRLQRFLQLRTVGKQKLRRGIIVEHAESLTIEAQNAFLKLLEEPPADTTIILTASNYRALLPTIRSRTQIISCLPPDGEALRSCFIDQGNEPKIVQQAFFLSGGLPGLMTALLSDDQTHPLTQGVAIAKQVLQLSVFERLVLVENLSKKRDEAKHIVEALLRIAQAGLDQAAASGEKAKLKQWHHILKQAMFADEAISKNANLKLTLDNLMLKVKH